MNIPHKIKQLEEKLGEGFDVFFLTNLECFKISYFCCEFNLFVDIKLSVNQFYSLNVEDDRQIEEIKVIIRGLLINKIKNDINKELEL